MSADLLTQVILPGALFLIMFGMGLSLRPQNFYQVAAAPKAVGIGLAAQLLLLPILAFILANLLQLSPEIAVGLMIIALAPSGATSNLFTFLSKGDVSLSISLTAVISIITPFTIPFVVALAMQYFMGTQSEFTLPIGKTILQLLVITVIPVALGMLIHAYKPKWAQAMQGFFKWFSVAFLALIILLIILKNAANMGSFFAQAGLATLLLNVIALLLGYQIARWSKLDKAQSTTIGFEVGLQNGTLALVVAGTLIGNTQMMIPAVTYSILMFITGALFARWISRR
ncbi:MULTISPECIES: bile acid:sodium symporter family protein [Thiomicrorhabdus]|uniref:Bile acid:sodium symporter family protein n=1 Tax=Thiomicrorhabdus heinhorstiae TaxID=2748010 RepID=A0ABS0BYX5_9GAMM|nr:MULTISPECIES: bile acid:sodium symporter family protein [Thiomicrorhabdus]MBF6057166.1 bile acid:sodium symporter family protein [Thiomicrorhabdus heinhorstiae]